MKKIASTVDKPFENSADKYSAYLETFEGRLRLDLAFANLQEFLPPRRVRPLFALDLGCGTGAVAVRLAQLGLHVTLLDLAVPMLDFAKRAMREAGVAERSILKCGDASHLADLLGAGSFDVIVCHNILEYTEDPSAVLQAAAGMLRDSSSIISVLARNRSGEVLKAAIHDGDLTASECKLSSEWGTEALFGGRVRLFGAEELQSMAVKASLKVISQRGVRVLSDYLPLSVSRSDEYERIFGLERKLATRPEFAAIARYTHCLAHRAG